MTIRFILFFLFIGQLSYGAPDDGTKAIAFVRSQAARYALDVDDLKELKVSSLHKDKFSKIEHIYLQQYHLGYPIEGAIAIVIEHPNGTMEMLNQGFLRHLSDIKKPLSIIPQATIKAQVARGIESESAKLRIAGLIWTPDGERIKLAYDLRYDTKLHFWRIWVEAENGREIKRKDLLLSCHPGRSLKNQQNFSTISVPQHVSTTTAGTYLVYPLGTESPLHGSRRLVSDPADPVASPFGWHDQNGIAGPDYLDTRGNNAFAQDDPAGDDLQDQRPKGGNDLQFIFNLDFNHPPRESVDAAVTNLFYWTNINHDIFYHYGFDEASGNFQINNYERGGLGKDMVRADAQDVSDRNNARFLVEEDGLEAKLQMHLWSDNLFDARIQIENAKGEMITIDAVESGFSKNNKLIMFDLREVDLVRVEDAGQNSHLGCVATGIANANEIAGKIVLVDRGQCFFVEKVRQLENLGALAVMVCNNVPGEPVVMGGDDQSITIPAVMISQDQCAILLGMMTDDLVKVNIENRQNIGDFDSSFDNLIITHEYGHGISIRLTGGSNNIECLDNQEQMGEGWSDYFGLMLTTDWANAEGASPRGIGTYVSNQSITGTGIRNYPYSTNRQVNMMNYDQVRGSPFTHAIGAIWCAMLWDMTWQIIATEGISEDLYYGDAGNNQAMRIVVEALKIQPCYPGFVDGRDAILKADSLLYQGAHHYQIWKAFAGRGLGAKAHQGSSNNTYDGISNFDLPDHFMTQIKDFTTEDREDHIQIDFTSIQEFDNQLFTLQRSIDEINFETLQIFEGRDLSLTDRSLDFKDYTVVPGQLYYYQLLQTDIADKERILGLDSAILIPVNDYLAIFPNPNEGVFSLKISRSIEGEVHLNLFDGSGALLRQKKVAADTMYSRLPLDYSDLPPGIYFLQLASNQDHFWRKIVIY